MTNPQFSAWNPGIESRIPLAYETLETIYRPDNTFTNLEEIRELARITGLDNDELVVFKPARLALHEVIIRITADIVILESDNEEDLGINFRQIADTILETYIHPVLADIESEYNFMRDQIQQKVEIEITKAFFSQPDKTKSQARFWSLFQPKKIKQPAILETKAEVELRVINSFKDKGLNIENAQDSAIYRSLYRVLGSIASQRGFLGNDKALLVKLATRHACNFYGARLIGKRIQWLMQQAISEQGYDVIPDAESAILISLKGTSAAGKSSLRPMLRKMMGQIGMNNGSYGTISPDIWRRLLLDYDSLGEAYKYAGRLTSYEVNVVDSKLDRYIRGKAETREAIPHLMVDRFRFDSFKSEKVSRVLHKTYVKYIDTLYMYFVITPPEATVERGWQRGLDRGRYKSVEDFLGHCVEAYEGIPKLLFKWLSKNQPQFVFEFLDNNVPIDHFPRLIAKGNQSRMDIYRPMGLVNIVQYQKINVSARTAEEVYRNASNFDISNNLTFLRQCIDKVELVRFFDPETNSTYLQFENRRPSVTDQAVFDSVLEGIDCFVLWNNGCMLK